MNSISSFRCNCIGRVGWIHKKTHLYPCFNQTETTRQPQLWQQWAANWYVKNEWQSKNYTNEVQKNDIQQRDKNNGPFHNGRKNEIEEHEHVQCTRCAPACTHCTKHAMRNLRNRPCKRTDIIILTVGLRYKGLGYKGIRDITNKSSKLPLS